MQLGDYFDLVHTRTKQVISLAKKENPEDAILGKGSFGVVYLIRLKDQYTGTGQEALRVRKSVIMNPDMLSVSENTCFALKLVKDPRQSAVLDNEVSILQTNEALLPRPDPATDPSATVYSVFPRYVSHWRHLDFFGRHYEVGLMMEYFDGITLHKVTKIISDWKEQYKQLQKKQNKLQEQGPSLKGMPCPKDGGGGGEDQTPGWQRKREETWEKMEQEKLRISMCINRMLLHVVYTLSYAIMYLHSRNLIHRDLKLENVMMDCEQNQTKIIDFGLSCFETQPDQNRYLCVPKICRYRKNSFFVGAPLYMSPEIIAINLEIEKRLQCKMRTGIMPPPAPRRPKEQPRRKKGEGEPFRVAQSQEVARDELPPPHDRHQATTRDHKPTTDYCTPSQNSCLGKSYSENDASKAIQEYEKWIEDMDRQESQEPKCAPTTECSSSFPPSFLLSSKSSSSSSSSSSSTRKESLKGTLGNNAKENPVTETHTGTKKCIRPKKTMLKPSDVWAFGIILYTLMEGTDPYYCSHEISNMEFFMHVEQMKSQGWSIQFSRFTQICVTSFFQDMVRKCLQLDYEQRPTAKQVFQETLTFAEKLSFVSSTSP